MQGHVILLQLVLLDVLNVPVSFIATLRNDKTASAEYLASQTHEYTWHTQTNGILKLLYLLWTIYACSHANVFPTLYLNLNRLPLESTIQ